MYEKLLGKYGRQFELSIPPFYCPLQRKDEVSMVSKWFCGSKNIRVSFPNT